jgi:hypothetical protein
VGERHVYPDERLDGILSQLKWSWGSLFGRRETKRRQRPDPKLITTEIAIREVVVWFVIPLIQSTPHDPHSREGHGCSEPSNVSWFSVFGVP